MAAQGRLTTRSRLLMALGLVSALGLWVCLVYCPDQYVTPLQNAVPADPHQGMATIVPSGSPKPSATPIPSQTPVREATYQTSGGLRYEDRDRYQQDLGKASTMMQATQALSGFFARYGVSVWTTSDTLPSTTRLSITWKRLDQSDAADLAGTKAFGSWLIDEWSKYPNAWVRVSNIQAVALVKDLANNGTPDWGEASPIGVVFYQVTPLDSLGPAGEDYMRRIIHHEFDHEVELQVRGGMQAPDGAWSAFNPAGFAYGKTIPNMQHPGPAFVTGYSESAIGEDKAELYSFLFVDADSKKLAVWEKTDPGLVGKAAYYRSFIRGQVPAMDDAYFNAINP